MIAPLIKDLLRQVVPLRHKRLMLRYALANGPEIAFGQLAAKGFRPGAAIDVGAFHGDWARTFARVFEEVPVLMIEAQPGKRPHLERVARRLGPHVALEMALLSAEAGREVPFFVMGTGSSTYVENTRAPRQEITLPTTTLDAVVARHPGLRPPYVLKVDVQGAELDVLRGGMDTLRQAEVVMLEVSLLEFNLGSPGWRDVVGFMEEEGFLVHDVAGLMRLATGDLCQMDLLFTRAGSALRPSGPLA